MQTSLIFTSMRRILKSVSCFVVALFYLFCAIALCICFNYCILKVNSSTIGEYVGKSFLSKRSKIYIIQSWSS